MYTAAVAGRLSHPKDMYDTALTALEKNVEKTQESPLYNPWIHPKKSVVGNSRVGWVWISKISLSSPQPANLYTNVSWGKALL